MQLICTLGVNESHTKKIYKVSNKEIIINKGLLLPFYYQTTT